MSETLVDEVGIIRYDWEEIKALYVANISPTEIARSLTKECPESFSTVQNTIHTRASRNDWQLLRDKASKLVSGDPDANLGVSKIARPSLISSVLAERRGRYLDITSKKLDETATALENTPINSLEQSAMAFKLLEPAHKIAVDVHGLNARESAAALQVNILSDPDACKVIIDTESAQE